MRHHSYESSHATKQAICAVLKALMAQKPLDKIAVGEIMEQCGMVRQHFYYHFEDIYDLVRWMFQQEALSLLKEQEGAQLWQEGLLQLFDYLQTNRAVCLCALHSLSRTHLKRFFHTDIYAIIHRTVTTLAEELGVLSRQSDLELLTHFYVIALSGLIESWLLGEIDKTPEELIAFLDVLLRNQVQGVAAQRAALEAQTQAEKSIPPVDSNEKLW